MWRWVLPAIVLLLVLLCRTRAGAEVAFSAEGVRVDLRISRFRLRLFPAKAPAHPQRPKKGKKPPKPKKSEKAPKNKKEEPEESGKRPSFSVEDGKDALRTLLPALGRVLRRTRRGIRIDPLRLSVTLGGRTDPAEAAKRYGQIQTAVWMGMPVLERLVEIREIHIHTGVDFEADGTAVEGEAGATFRIGTLFAIGGGLLFPALKWLLRARRKQDVSEKKDGNETAAA